MEKLPELPKTTNLQHIALSRPKRKKSHVARNSPSNSVSGIDTLTKDDEKEKEEFLTDFFQNSTNT